MGFMSDSYKGHSALNRTPGQQRNVQAKQAETNGYATQARLGGAAGRLNTPEQGKRNMQPPAAPTMNNNLSSVQQAVTKAVALKRLSHRVAKVFAKTNQTH